MAGWQVVVTDNEDGTHVIIGEYSDESDAYKARDIEIAEIAYDDPDADVRVEVREVP